MINKIVMRYADGKLRKGTTADFFPNKDIFHLNDKDDGKIYEINVLDLKAVFFVKTYEGDPAYDEKLNIERVGTCLQCFERSLSCSYRAFAACHARSIT